MPPETVTLRGSHCLLRAFRQDELGELIAARAASESIAGPREPGGRLREQLRRRIERSARVLNGWLEFAIEVDGRLAGDVQARSGRRMLPPGVWELGIDLYGTGNRGKGVGGEAVALITEHLFTVEGAGRVQATTDVANAPMRAVLRRLGFTEEGVLRGFMADAAPDGLRHDYVMAGVTRDTWVAGTAARAAATRR